MGRGRTILAVTLAFGVTMFSGDSIDTVVGGESRPQQIQSVQRITFEQAVKNEELRQRYLDQVLREQEMPEIGAIQYDPNFRGYVYCQKEYGTSLEKITGMVEHFQKYKTTMCVPTISPAIGRNLPHLLFVFLPCFESDIKTEGEFLLELGHEYSVTKDFHDGIRIGGTKLDYNNIDQLGEELVRAIVEARAYYTQLRKIIEGRIPVNDQYMLRLSENYLDFYNTIEVASRKDDFSGRMAKQILDSISDLIPVVEGENIRLYLMPEKGLIYNEAG